MRGYNFTEITCYGDKTRVFKSEQGNITIYRPFKRVKIEDIEGNDKFSAAFVENDRYVRQKQWEDKIVVSGIVILIIILMLNLLI